MLQIDNKSGFTLIELLVTVSILGILAAQSVALFSEYKIEAHNVAAKVMGRDLFVAGEAVADVLLENATTSSPSSSCVGGGNVAKNCTEVNHTSAITIESLTNDAYYTDSDYYSTIVVTYSNGAPGIASYVFPCKGDVRYYFQSTEDTLKLYKANELMTWALFCP